MRNLKTLEKEDLWQAAIELICSEWREYAKVSSPVETEHFFYLLPLPCQHFAAINAIHSEVNNGGFNQYFFNQWAANMPVSAADSLAAVGAIELSKIASQAVRMYEDAYMGVAERLENHRDWTMENFMALYKDDPFRPLDDEYYGLSEIEDLEGLVDAYIRANIECFETLHIEKLI
ncbi:MAG: DMP19 family protein [Thermoguttaceae bacterium]